MPLAIAQRRPSQATASQGTTSRGTPAPVESATQAQRSKLGIAAPASTGSRSSTASGWSGVTSAASTLGRGLGSVLSVRGVALGALLVVAAFGQPAVIGAAARPLQNRQDFAPAEGQRRELLRASSRSLRKPTQRPTSKAKPSKPIAPQRPSAKPVRAGAVTAAPTTASISPAECRPWSEHVGPQRQRYEESPYYRPDLQGHSLLVDFQHYAVDHDRQVIAARAQRVLESFVQGQEGNCVSVASIKAAQVRFGDTPAMIFRTFTAHPDGSASAVMRDGFSVELSAEELAAATTASEFTGDPAVLQRANLFFAFGAKRYTLQTFGTSYPEALLHLNSGIAFDEAFALLGLSAFVTPVELSKVHYSRTAVLVYLSPTEGHEVYVDGNRIDLWGTNIKIPKQIDGLKEVLGVRLV